MFIESKSCRYKMRMSLAFFALSLFVIYSKFQEILTYSRITQFSGKTSLGGYTCPVNYIVFELEKSMSDIHCARVCQSYSTCFGVFYQPETLLCVGCSAENEADLLSTPSISLYYERSDVSDTTVLLSQYGNPCTTNADCTMHAGTCLQGTCSCQAGFRYDTTSDSCVTKCVNYGSTYIEYLNMELSVDYTAEYFGVTLMQCQAYCTSSSSCRGVNYSPVFSGGMCRLKSETDPSAFMSFNNVNYYTRNCA